MADVKDYAGENQRILNEWCEKFVQDKLKDKEYDGYEREKYFAKDGLMNRGDFEYKDGVWLRKMSEGGKKENKLWREAPLRILFLTKDENTGGDEAWDVRQETFYAKYKEREVNAFSNSFFYQNEACLLYGLLHTNLHNGLFDFEKFSWEDALQFSNEQIFARINCKKEVGYEKIDDKDLLRSIMIEKYDKNYLKEQISSLDADVFICCGSRSDKNIILDTLNECYDKKFKWIGYATWFNEEENKLAIDAYHLSFFKYGGLKARYDEVVGVYYNFIKYIHDKKGIDFTRHR